MKPMMFRSSHQCCISCQLHTSTEVKWMSASECVYRWSYQRSISPCDHMSFTRCIRSWRRLCRSRQDKCPHDSMFDEIARQIKQSARIRASSCIQTSVLVIIVRWANQSTYPRMRHWIACKSRHTDVGLLAILTKSAGWK